MTATAGPVLDVENIEVVYNDTAGNSGSDVLKINYEKKKTTESSTKTAIANLWWLFGIAIAAAIILLIMVPRTRKKWMAEHPELERYESGGGAVEEGYYDDPYARRGGGY